MSGIAWLLSILRKAGDKLPEALPIILHMADDAKKLYALLGPIFMAGPSTAADTDECRELLLAGNVSAKDTDKIVDAFAQV